VAFHDFEEVWAALGRIYNDIVRLQESQQLVTVQLTQVTERMGTFVDGLQGLADGQKRLADGLERLTVSQEQFCEGQERLTTTLAALAGTTTKIADVVATHERRLGNPEEQ
jgi:uncharacterized phage infection (PIP) family protein YhgE